LSTSRGATAPPRGKTVAELRQNATGAPRGSSSHSTSSLWQNAAGPAGIAGERRWGGSTCGMALPERAVVACEPSLVCSTLCLNMPGSASRNLAQPRASRPQIWPKLGASFAALGRACARVDLLGPRATGTVEHFSNTCPNTCSTAERRGCASSGAPRARALP
jgi:hypothetical protein